MSILHPWGIIEVSSTAHEVLGFWLSAKTYRIRHTSQRKEIHHNNLSLLCSAQKANADHRRIWSTLALWAGQYYEVKWMPLHHSVLQHLCFQEFKELWIFGISKNHSQVKELSHFSYMRSVIGKRKSRALQMCRNVMQPARLTKVGGSALGHELVVPFCSHLCIITHDRAWCAVLCCSAFVIWRQWCMCVLWRQWMPLLP